MVREARHVDELSAQHSEGAVFSEGSAILWRVKVPARLMRLRGWWALRTGRREGLSTCLGLGYPRRRRYRARVGQEGRAEAVALPIYRFDQRQPATMIAYRLAGSGQALGQRRFTDKRAGPAGLQEFVPCHHTILMLDEVEKHLIHFGLNGNDCARTTQLIALRIEDTITKAIDHCDGPTTTASLLYQPYSTVRYATPRQTIDRRIVVDRKCNHIFSPYAIACPLLFVRQSSPFRHDFLPR